MNDSSHNQIPSLLPPLLYDIVVGIQTDKRLIEELTMAKTHSKLKSTTCKAPTQPITERFYTVGYTPNLGSPNLDRN